MTHPPQPTRGAVASWGLWDWAFSAFNAVATTFVFNTYPAYRTNPRGIALAMAA